MRKISQFIGRITTDPRAQFTVVLATLILSHDHAQAVQDSIAAGGIVGVLAPRKRP
ncbi:hypothetical protein [Actinacidiphila acididurans]|uniref:Uncharacterized protein n=1 Tax=Actinacidiphila acididurans TaxID=2784346 RepID=A0ABS2U2Y6_9ACTN|nr:hypothetical protein [Actinacidiphila acididurans]MBM9509946.1 hypothetical protein [Actinacidiphila acididurans]